MNHFSEVGSWQKMKCIVIFQNVIYDVLVRQRNSIFLVDLDLRCIENVLTDYDSQHLQKQEST